MSYLINAWLEHGEPRLGIVDAQTGVVQQLWQLSKIGGSGAKPVRRDISRIKSSGIQQLTKELFLMGCVEDISLMQRVRTRDIGGTCLGCDQCTDQYADQHARQATADSNIVYLDLINRRSI